MSGTVSDDPRALSITVYPNGAVDIYKNPALTYGQWLEALSRAEHAASVMQETALRDDY